MPTKELRTPEPLDEVDRKLVALLRADARIPNSRLAGQAGIAPSTCVTRVRGLVERGVITGFTATIDADAVGVGLQALISIAIRAGARHEMARFADEMRELADVVQLFFLGGSEDFIVHIAVRDSDHLRDFVLDHLSAHPAVASTRTSVVFDHHYSGPAVGDPGD